MGKRGEFGLDVLRSKWECDTKQKGPRAQEEGTFGVRGLSSRSQV